MILSCPECKTRFVVPDEAIGPNGRTVRCSECGATWFVANDPDILELEDNKTPEISKHHYDPHSDDYDHEDVPQVDPVIEDPLSHGNYTEPQNGPAIHTVLRDQTERKRVRKKLFGVGLIWIITLAIISTFLIAAYVFRAQIIEKFPGANRIYNSLGIEASASGLKFYDVEGKFGENDGNPVLFVTGKIENYDNRPRPVGMIQITFKNASDEAVGEWAIEPPQPTLPAGESLEFSAQYPDPPVDAVGLTASFLDENS